MNKAQAMVEIETVQTGSVLEQIARTAAQKMLAVALRAEADAYWKIHLNGPPKSASN